MTELYSTVKEEYRRITKDLSMNAQFMEDADVDILTGWQEALNFVMLQMKEKGLK